MKNTMYGEPDQKVLKQTEPGCPWASSAVTSPSTTVPAARCSSSRATCGNSWVFSLPNSSGAPPPGGSRRA